MRLRASAAVVALAVSGGALLIASCPVAAAASSNTYYADATDVDWSRVGEYAKTGWFYPMNKWFSPASLQSDVPQLDTFMVNGKLIADTRAALTLKEAACPAVQYIEVGAED